MLEAAVVVALVAAFAVVAGVAGLAVRRLWTATESPTTRPDVATHQAGRDEPEG